MPDLSFPATLLRPAVVVALLGFASAQQDVHPDELKMKPEIDAAIARGVEYLVEEQLRDGSWGLHGDYVGGRGGLALYTLLQCGVDRDHPAVKRAVAYLDGVEPDRTYATTCMILAYDALRDGRDERIRAFVDKLLDWQKPGGDWGYPHAGPDLSCTQYAALGLYVGYKRGIEIDASHWLDLLDALEDYRGDVQKIPNPQKDGRTGATKVDVAGYRYSRNAPQQPVTGSMTSAALAVIEICKAGLGRKLRRSQRNQLDERTEAALTWLGQHFDVARNPFGGHEYYYLYGLERAGALTQREQFGTHWWYVEGARHLLATQDKQRGSWRGVNETCFALLFLRRATSGNAPTTGGAVAAKHSFAAGTADSDVRLRGAGQKPLSLWVDGFGEGLLDVHRDHGLRVVSVVYEDDKGQVLAKVPGDPTKTWNKETFLHRDKAIARGTHRIRARVTVLADDCEPGETDPVAVLESDWMEVRIRDVLEPWMETALDAYRANLLLSADAEVSASSELNKEHEGRNLVDGFESRRWIASPDDQAPTVTITWRKPVAVGRIVFTGLAHHDRELGQYDDFGALEVRFGNDRDRWTRIPVGEDRLAPVVFDLPKARRLRRLQFRFVERVRRNGQIGLSEFVLLPAADARRR